MRNRETFEEVVEYFKSKQTQQKIKHMGKASDFELTDCLTYIVKYLQTHSRPFTSGIDCANRDDLREALRLKCLKDANNLFVEFSDDNYIKWVECLCEDFHWKERVPTGLWKLIKTAREKWKIERNGRTNKIVNSVALKHTPSHLKSPNAVLTTSTSILKNTSVKPKDKGLAVYSEIEINDIQSDADEFSLRDEKTNVFRQCDFCNKDAIVFERTGMLIDRLSGEEGFYCPFCVRHDFHTKKRKNVLMLSLRPIIGYLYHGCYHIKSSKLAVSEIQDLIDFHIQIGLLNPVFTYDKDAYLWFIDFAKVGDTKRKIPLYEVIRTVNELISAFNPYENIHGFDSFKYSSRFLEALTSFYQQRYRPPDKKQLIPTLVNCADDAKDPSATPKETKKLDLVTYKEFMPNNLHVHYRR